MSSLVFFRHFFPHNVISFRTSKKKKVYRLLSLFLHLVGGLVPWSNARWMMHVMLLD